VPPLSQVMRATYQGLDKRVAKYGSENGRFLVISNNIGIEVVLLSYDKEEDKPPW
jgi:hypothetical protein